MRTILEYDITTTNNSEPAVEALALLNDSGWVVEDLGLSGRLLAEMALGIITRAEKESRELPLSPDSQLIQNEIDRNFAGPDGSGGDRPMLLQSRFDVGTHERLCLEQALLILTQIDPKKRRELFQQDMTVVVGPRFTVYGIIFRAASNGRTTHFDARLRSNDIDRLQEATASFVSALLPGKRPATRRFYSSAAAIGRESLGTAVIETDFRRPEIRSVVNEPLFEGEVIPIKSRISLIRHAITDGASRILAALSVLFIGISLVLFMFFPHDSWWNWSEQLAGRLATGAFGALLVDSAIDYAALRKSMMSGTGPIVHGALIRWKRSHQR